MNQAAIHQRVSRTRRRRRAVSLAVLVLLVALAGLFHRFLFLGNFAVVEPGRVYRSGQPKADFDQTLREHRIASVLNLRGGSRSDWWYANEVDTTRALGLDFYDFPMAAGQRPSRSELLQLLDLFDRAPYPLLIHCKSGSDRTGLACALYDLAVRGASPEQARTAFSLWRGHIPLFGPERLHEPIDEYADWLQDRRLVHTPDRFRQWVEHDYRSDSPDRFKPVRPGPRAELAAAPGATTRR